MTLPVLPGSMFHKDAHTGPGGLYAPDGQLRSVYERAQMELGGADPLIFLQAYANADVEQMPSGNYIVNGVVVGQSHFESGAWGLGIDEDQIDEVGVLLDLIAIGGGAYAGHGPMVMRQIIGSLLGAGATSLDDLADEFGGSE